jgi:hypothetical protein
MRENLTSGSRWQGMETRLIKLRRHSLTLPLDAWDSSASIGITLASSFHCSQAISTPTPAPVTQAVETVEKVPIQKLVFESERKSSKNTMFLVFRTTFWLIFEPVVGDILEYFSNQGFFDSLVGTPLVKKENWNKKLY